MFVVQTFIRHNVFRMSFECLQVTIEHLKKKKFLLNNNSFQVCNVYKPF